MINFEHFLLPRSWVRYIYLHWKRRKCFCDFEKKNLKDKSAMHKKKAFCHARFAAAEGRGGTVSATDDKLIYTYLPRPEARPIGGWAPGKGDTNKDPRLKPKMSSRIARLNIHKNNKFSLLQQFRTMFTTDFGTSKKIQGP